MEGTVLVQVTLLMRTVASSLWLIVLVAVIKGLEQYGKTAPTESYVGAPAIVGRPPMY